MRSSVVLAAGCSRRPFRSRLPVEVHCATYMRAWLRAAADARGWADVRRPSECVYGAISASLIPVRRDADAIVGGEYTTGVLAPLYSVRIGGKVRASGCLGEGGDVP
jgi:hypothetical protein